MLAASAVLTALAGCSPNANQAGTATLNPINISQTSQGFSISEGEEQVMFYQRQHKSMDGKYTRANYIHPLYGLYGEILTEDFPADHLHHRGVFWAWHQVWLGDKKLGDGWATIDFFWDVYDVEILTIDSQSRALRLGVYWKSPLLTDANGKQQAFVKETTTIRVHRAEGDIRKIDLSLRKQGSGNVRVLMDSRFRGNDRLCYDNRSIYRSIRLKGGQFEMFIAG